MFSKEQWKDPQWQKKRLEIMKRDDWKCVNCGADNEMLSVHHMFYDLENYPNPWDYPDGTLVTLCEMCHSESHETRYYLPSRYIDLLWLNELSPTKMDEMWLNHHFPNRMVK